MSFNFVFFTDILGQSASFPPLLITVHLNYSVGFWKTSVGCQKKMNYKGKILFKSDGTAF